MFIIILFSDYPYIERYESGISEIPAIWIHEYNNEFIAITLHR